MKGLRPFRAVALTLLLLVSPLALAREPLTLYPSEQQAQQHCPADIVVWLNTPTGIYHFRGQRWYGHTNHGAYVCEREADRAGNRATHNGQ